MTIDIQDVAKQIGTIGFLRNKNLYTSRTEAINAMKKQLGSDAPNGSMILSRYRDKRGIKSLIGIIYNDGVRKSLTTFKVDDVIEDFELNDNNLHYGDLYREYSNNQTQPGTTS